MDTDCYGIAHQFEDAFGVLRVTSRETRDALRRAMHADDKPPGLPSVRVVDYRRRTSVRLEPEMWDALREISLREQCKIHDICSLVNMRKGPNTSLTAAIRVFLRGCTR